MADVTSQVKPLFKQDLPNPNTNSNSLIEYPLIWQQCVVRREVAKCFQRFQVESFGLSEFERVVYPNIFLEIPEFRPNMI